MHQGRRRVVPCSDLSSHGTSEHCKFSASANDVLQDQLVCGQADTNMQHKCLVEPDLTLDTVLTTAESSMETTEQNTAPQQKGSHKVHAVLRPTISDGE